MRVSGLVMCVSVSVCVCMCVSVCFACAVWQLSRRFYNALKIQFTQIEKSTRWLHRLNFRIDSSHNTGTHTHAHIQPHCLPLPNIDTRQCCQLREKHVQWRLNNLFMLSYARQRERRCHCRCLCRCRCVQGIPWNGQLLGHIKLIKNNARWFPYSASPGRVFSVPI